MEEKEKIRVHYKSTIWTELKFECTPEQKKQILEVLENFGLDYIIDDTLGFEESETLFDTEEFIPPEENSGFETIEVYDGNSKLIWDNVNNKL
jgi:hypothetical protein